MNEHQPRISILIPTLNAGHRWLEALEAINRQTAAISRKIIIDSGSTDNTVSHARQYGFEVFSIPATTFNHGRVRQQLAELATDTDICVFLTQDAILSADDSVGNLVKKFSAPEIALAYG